MEQTTLQQRIEERAKQKLLKDLYDAAQKELSILNLVNISTKDRLWEQKLNVIERYTEYSTPHTGIHISGEYTQKVFDTLLPKYISVVTDEILQKIDEIDYLLEEKQSQTQYY